MTGSLWVYLSTTPLLWLTLTVGAWVVGDAVARRSHQHPLANPVLIGIALICALLLATGTPYATYFAGAQFVHFLLGPAIVAIGVPLFRYRAAVRRTLVPMGAALVVGAVVAIVSVLLMARAFGLPHDLLVALAPKSVTAGVAMGISESLGGQPALTAMFGLATGLIGAMTVTPLMNALGIRDYEARGFSAGLAAHGLGTARAYIVDPVAGTFAGIAMGLNAIAASFLVPILARWLL